MTTFPAICRHANDERAVITRNVIRFEVRIPTTGLDALSDAPRNEWRQTPHVSARLKREARAMQQGIANPRTVRFWTYETAVGGWVRLALRDGQALRYCSNRPHSEGYHREYTEWERDGERVICRSSVYSSDCDGRHEYHTESYFHIDDAEADSVVDFETGEYIRKPLWQAGATSQRDAYAEAAGY